jgi:hypothetical protein
VTVDAEMIRELRAKISPRAKITPPPWRAESYYVWADDEDGTLLVGDCDIKEVAEWIARSPEMVDWLLERCAEAEWLIRTCCHGMTVREVDDWFHRRDLFLGEARDV